MLYAQVSLPHPSKLAVLSDLEIDQYLTEWAIAEKNRTSRTVSGGEPFRYVYQLFFDYITQTSCITIDLPASQGIFLDSCIVSVVSNMEQMQPSVLLRCTGASSRCKSLSWQVMPQYCHRANSCLLLFTAHVAATTSCVTNVKMLQDTPRLAALSEKVIWDEIMQQEAPCLQAPRTWML